ncbi:MAG: hypothetical protein J0H81_05720 [Sphingopyxis terrae]|nr:hypothetical protein [Sphingopyxis terrae]
MKADMVPDSGIAAGTVSRRDWTALLALALVLRLVAAWQESVLHPDEVFQYLEGAFRLLHGYSVVTWEYRDGMRGDLYPALLALPMRLGEWIAPDGSLTIWLPRMVMAILSLGIVAAAGVIGARVSRLHFWAAGLIAACWPDLVAFAPHPLTEQMAALLAAPAIALLGLPGRCARQLTIIGAAVGLAVVFRPHVAPALALGLLVHVWRAGPRSLWPLVAGGLVGLAIGAVSDVAGGHWPFEWLVHNVDRNIVDNVSARYGVSGPFQYAVDLLALWGLWTAPILVLATLGARRYPLLAVVAIANILVHSAIGHKEYRFIILSVTAIILLAGIGTGDAIAALRAQRGRQGWRVALVLGAGWLAAATYVAPALYHLGGRVVTPFSAAASDRLRAKPGLCGMAVVGNRVFRVYGYARLQRRVPIFVQAPGDPRVDPAQFNAALVWKGHADALTPDFRATTCSADGSQCVYERPGGCSAATSRAEINRYLADRGM